MIMELMEYDTMVVAITASGLSLPTLSVIFCAMLWKKGTTSIWGGVLAGFSVNTGKEGSHQLRANRTLEDARRGEGQL